MKIAFTAALIAAAALAGTAQAQDISAGTASAIAHFNQDQDTQDGRVSLSAASDATASSRTGEFANVFTRFNADHDGQDNVRGQGGATLVSGIPAVAQGIFETLREEDRDND